MPFVSVDFETITICGSMRFYDTMLEVAASLSLSGHIVLMPFCNMKEPMYEGMGVEKVMLDRMHYAKIDLSRSIYVVNGTSSDAVLEQPHLHTYVGESTIREMAYARRSGKAIRYHIQPLAKENVAI